MLNNVSIRHTYIYIYIYFLTSSVVYIMKKKYNRGLIQPKNDKEEEEEEEKTKFSQVTKVIKKMQENQVLLDGKIGEEL